MSEINYQALREAAEHAIPAMERLLMLPADDDLLTEQELKDYGVDIDALNAFKFLTGPETMLALLDERERNQQYIKRRDQENEDIALTVGKLRVELEAAKKRMTEQSAIVAAAEKLVRCKGRYHSELNYRALAKLFGVITPDLPPLVHENVHYADAAEVEITALRQRIAELEAKLETADKLQDSAFRDGLKAGFSYGQTDDQSGFAQCMSAYSTRAGIGVKQQEDSVDSDVGRNQPGMVVAVHICAGDFVKVKGQVFEVEETDFDDHDVTLWFVGGNALKCEAGCPVEVVSAPVAAGIKVKGE
ncbi:ead/Ea22-like family protein [Salmonella enterica]|uniref:ead/Ea22-like family protein n=1 Tax=Salmonella enterica TaxID=28901 RepID=UPI00041636BE|nr:ead/Ea22-like family protein [Salmonella enterica]ECC3408866.1 ead/Ea22-like family protein [Salmonella enterica subsp. enterica]EAA3915650.1 ead/Ea22-like family protein [Salmonella enterica subsp. enterica serovar Kedougou]EBV3828176.1 ead/Ea22-like family protein [Salmonella enterica subsp. enterica serovar Kedougou]EBX4909335.1 ead/Ea22-like family protein [Salmonella enterica subsp. enterica serovar Kedougou]ECK4894193.1 ead/Ea22-like family protein [Salmonella enterica]